MYCTILARVTAAYNRASSSCVQRVKIQQTDGSRGLFHAKHFFFFIYLSHFSHPKILAIPQDIVLLFHLKDFFGLNMTLFSYLLDSVKCN